MLPLRKSMTLKLTWTVWLKRTRFVTCDIESDNRFCVVIGRVTNQRSEDSEIIGMVLKVVLFPNRFKDGLKLLWSIQRWYTLCCKTYFPRRPRSFSCYLFRCCLFHSVLAIPKKDKRILNGHCSKDLTSLGWWLLDTLFNTKESGKNLSKTLCPCHWIYFWTATGWRSTIFLILRSLERT